MEIIPSIWQGSFLVQYPWLSLADFSRQRNPEHLRVTPALKPQCVVGRKGSGGGIGPLLPLRAADTGAALHWCSRWTMGVGLSLFGEVTLLQQRVKKDSLVPLRAALAPLQCSVTPGSEVRAQLWLRNWGHHGAGERWPGETVPMSSARDWQGSAPALCLSALHPCIWVRPCTLLPLHKCPSGDTRLKSVGTEGLKEKISFAE